MSTSPKPCSPNPFRPAFNASRRRNLREVFAETAAFDRKAEHNCGVARGDAPPSQPSGSSTGGVLTAVYGIVLLAAAIAYYILQTMLLRGEGERSVLRTALGSDVKGKISPPLYCLGIGLSFVDRWLALAVYVGVALMWLVPDRRVERHVSTIPRKPTG